MKQLRTLAAAAFVLGLAACANGRVLRTQDRAAASDSWLSSEPMVLTHVRPLHGGQATTEIEHAMPGRLRLAPGWYEVFFSCAHLPRDAGVATISMVEYSTSRRLHASARKRYRAECSTRQFHRLRIVEEPGTEARAARVLCTAGPLAIDYGGQPWHAFACDDGRSVALLSAPGNAAAPFSFVLRPGDHGVRVQGDGAGDRIATAAAFAELMALDAAALSTLYTQALLAPVPDER